MGVHLINVTTEFVHISVDWLKYKACTGYKNI